MNKKNKQITIEEMKKIELDILSQFSDFCDKYKLEYSLCGGTLLGAIRHKGFIPWDDDIDVFVTRKTYDYLCKHFNKWGKQNNLRLVNYYSNHYYSTFAKIIDTRTKAIEEKRNEKIGVWIDLFIVESMKSNEESFNGQISNYLKEIRYFGNEEYFPSIHSFKDCLIFLKKWLIRFFEKPLLRKKIESFIFNNPGSFDVAFSFADQISWWHSCNKLDFLNSVELEFEGKQFKSIGNWNDYLVHRYGVSYMTPPPLSQREKHQLIKCEWKSKYKK